MQILIPRKQTCIQDAACFCRPMGLYNVMKYFIHVNLGITEQNKDKKCIISLSQIIAVREYCSYRRTGKLIYYETIENRKPFVKRDIVIV